MLLRTTSIVKLYDFKFKRESLQAILDLLVELLCLPHFVRLQKIQDGGHLGLPYGNNEEKTSEAIHVLVRLVMIQPK